MSRAVAHRCMAMSCHRDTTMKGFRQYECGVRADPRRPLTRPPAHSSTTQSSNQAKVNRRPSVLVAVVVSVKSKGVVGSGKNSEREATAGAVTQARRQRQKRPSAPSAQRVLYRPRRNWCVWIFVSVATRTQTCLPYRTGHDQRKECGQIHAVRTVGSVDKTANRRMVCHVGRACTLIILQSSMSHARQCSIIRL